MARRDARRSSSARLHRCARHVVSNRVLVFEKWVAEVDRTLVTVREGQTSITKAAREPRRFLTKRRALHARTDQRGAVRE